MKNKNLILGGIAASICLVVTLTLYFSNSQVTDVSAKQVGSEEGHHTTPDPSELLQTADSGSTRSVDSEPKDMATDDEQDNPYLDESLKAQLMQVADLYEANMQYPPHSQPIRSADELRQFQPDHSPASVELPFFREGTGEEVRLSLDLDQYQFFTNDPIPVAVSVQTADGDVATAIDLSLTDRQGTLLMRQRLTEPRQEWLTLFDTSQARNDGWPVELQVRALVTVDGEQFFITAPLRYQQAVATLESIGYSQVAQENLLIPLHFRVQQPGYYFIAANLYSRQTGAPLLHLQTEGRLEQGMADLNLKAHIAALKAKGDEGPYTLKDIAITRAAEIGETYDLSGRSVRKSFPVEGYPFSDYQDVAYEDPLTRERLEFLRQLGKL